MSTYIWLAIILVLSFIEVSTTNLTTIWFVVSGIIALILSFFTSNDVVLWSEFVLVGVILLITTKPFLQKFLNVKSVPTNLDRIIGTIAVVTEEIKKDEVGEVKVDGKKWGAQSNSHIKVGEKVMIEKINGVKLIVRKEDV